VDQDHYSETWTGLGLKVEKVLLPLGFRFGSFDPDLVFYHVNRDALHLPPDVAVHLIATWAESRRLTLGGRKR
jgi:hypothetical protein